MPGITLRNQTTKPQEFCCPNLDSGDGCGRIWAFRLVSKFGEDRARLIPFREKTLPQKSLPSFRFVTVAMLKPYGA